MAQINGSFSGYSTSIYKPYIVYSYTQDIPNNQSTVSWELFFAKYNASYFAFNTGGFPCTISVNGTVFNGDETFDLRSGSVPEIESIRSGTRTVAHNSDGTKSIYIGASGDTATALGTFNFGQTIALATIPREAYITNSSVNFTVENAVALTLSNAGNMYVKIELYVNGNLIATRNAGQVSSYNFDPDSGEDADIYAEMPSSTSTSMYFRVKTYSDSGYTTQIGSNKDKAGTVSINTTTNKPTFTDWAVANVDKTVNNVDKYANTLVSSSTETLLGGTNKVIKGYSKVRATVSTANKAVALNSATMVKYRFVAGALDKEENYSGVADVTIDIDNVLVKDFTVTATDSRNLSTSVNKSLANLAEYTVPTISSISLARDNSVDALTKLQLSGAYWKEYFGGGVAGVQNTITAHYRFKRSTLSWSALDGTFTVTIASPAVVTKSTHGLSTGDIVYLTTTGALPTGLSANTHYYVIKNDANTFWLATSYANAIAGTKINTSGTQSGTHTLHAQSMWTSFTPTDTSGALSYNTYINGDLGASGFNTNLSFDIEVRIYDKLSNTISEKNLPVGTPVMHKTKTAIATFGKVNTGLTSKNQLNGGLALDGVDVTSTPAELNILDGVTANKDEINALDGILRTVGELNSIKDGWIPLTGTFAYSSATVFTTSADYSAILNTVGVKLKVVQGANTKYLYTASATSGAVTTIANTDYSIANSSVDAVYFSYGNPTDFPSTHQYTTTLGGFTTSTATFRFRIDGRVMTVYVSFSGTSNSTSTTFTVPVTPVLANRGYYNGRDNNTLAHRMYEVTTSNSTVTCWATVTGGSWTNSGTKSFVNFLMQMIV